MKNILIAISQPEDAKQLNSQAVKTAQDTGGKRWIVHVSESTSNSVSAKATCTPLPPEILQSSRTGLQFLY